MIKKAGNKFEPWKKDPFIAFANKKAGTRPALSKVNVRLQIGLHDDAADIGQVEVHGNDAEAAAVGDEVLD